MKQISDAQLQLPDTPPEAASRRTPARHPDPAGSPAARQSASSRGCEYRLLEQDNETAIDELAAHGFRFQLVYLDPPYNTGRRRGARRGFGDTRRDWREGVRRIATAAHGMTHDKGFLAASINQVELFNLKAILDDVFGAECFIGVFPVKIRHKARQLMINATFHDVFEYLLMYRKNKTTRFFTERSGAREDKFVFDIETPRTPSDTRIINGKKVDIFLPGHYKIIECGYKPSAFRRYVIAGKLATANWSGEWYENHLRPLGSDLLIRVWGLENEGLGYRWFQSGNARRSSGVYFQSQRSAGRPILPTNDLDYTEVVPTMFKEGGPGCDYKDSKKPEALMAFLMNICTKGGDWVLDPYGGSGTTLAVAVKLGRSACVIENNAAALAIIRKRIANLKEGRDIDGVRHAFSMSEGLSPTNKARAAR